MTDHTCPACAIAAELDAHRNKTAARWDKRRAALNFAVIVARSHCTQEETK
jgi:hypothetical protein